MSLTFSGLIVAALAWVLQRAGVQIGNADLTQFVLTVVQIVGGLVAYIGRIRMGDITWYGTRKLV